MKKSTNSSDERVTYKESVAYAIAETLREKGYEVASCSGMRQTEPDHNVIGILNPKNSIQKSFLGIKGYKRASFLGTLWLENESRGAEENKKWVLEVYGRENIPELTELVKELSGPSGVRVQVILDSEQPVFEKHLSDYNGF